MYSIFTYYQRWLCFSHLKDSDAPGHKTVVVVLIVVFVVLLVVVVVGFS